MPDPSSSRPIPWVITSEWRAKPGAQERLAQICDELTERSRAEPGNLFFQTLRSSTDPGLFYLYEEYVDEAAYQVHVATAHFTRLVEGEAIPLLLEADALERVEASARLVNLSPTVPHGLWVAGRKPPAWRAGRHGGSALRAFVDGAHTDSAALDGVIGTAVVLDLTPVAGRAAIDASAFDRAEARLQACGEEIQPHDILLLRTDWTERADGSPEWFRHSPSLTRDAALWLVAHRPSCLGCDFFEADAPVQRQILDAGIPLVDGLVNLAALPARCEFFAPFCDFRVIGPPSVRAFAWAWEAA